MAKELDMSLTRYLQIKDILVPKHLAGNTIQRKRDMLRKLVLAESPFEIIQKAKQKYLRPIGQIETIMNHFDSKFSNRRVKMGESSEQPKKRNRAASNMTETSNNYHELKSKMQHLINLPLIGKVKQEAQKYRGIINADIIKQKEQRRAKIMEEFNGYMQAQMRGNPKPSIQRRLHTIQ